MRTFSILGALAAIAASLVPVPAHACGGTFCDAGPQSMPVDQTGETIIFVMDGESVEAHIQIEYDPTTDAERFAWLVPLTAVPEFEVGSEKLFENVLAGSVPTYGFNTWNETCDSGDDGGGGGGGGGGWCGDGDGDGDGWGDGEDDGGGTQFVPTSDAGPPGPEIVKQEVVGAFEITVLQGGTAEEVMIWLEENGYQQDPAAEPILEQYLEEDYLFAAFKLVNGAETETIHPVTIRYAGTESCVPIRLTQIAAQDDMRIRVFFLGNSRAAPTNYLHVELNSAAIDWVGRGTNYDDVVSLAVDEGIADGHAFVTEYAGTSEVVSQTDLYDDRWDPDAFVNADPVDVIGMLSAQRLFEGCEFTETCSWAHPLIEGIVDTYLPVPEGISEAAFYSCPECYEGLVEHEAWDGPAFAEQMRQRIVEPGMHAVDLLETWPFLTRMYTTLSPHEMNEDPFFHLNPQLASVDLPQLGQRDRYCNGENVFELDDQRDLILRGGSWPDIEMPYAERVESIPLVGAPQVLIDSRMKIDEAIDAWNTENGWNGFPQGERPLCDDDGGDDDGSGGHNGSGTDTVDAGGCGCTTEDQPRGAWLFMGLALASLVRVRRSPGRN